MESGVSDKPVPREINALLSDERLILRETQRAVTPFGWDRGFHFLLGQDWLRGSGPAAHANSLAFAESDRSEFHFHRLPDIGAGRSQAFRSRESTARRSRAAGALGPAALFHR